MPSKPAYQTQGIVIGRTNFGEADRVVRFLTAGYGKVSAVAKGVRKIKSRSGGHLELFGEVNLMLIAGRNLDTVTSARLLWYPHDFVSHYDRLELAFIIARTVDRLTEPGQPTPGLYELTREALGALDDGPSDIVLIELWFKLRLLDVLGYRPELGACIICGQQSAETTYAFSTERGGIVCHADSNPLDTPMSTEQIKFWRLLSDYPYQTIAHIADAPALATATLSLCNTFYEHHLSYSFLATSTFDKNDKK
ncbi:MAG TPA: DNA repair protein RecO [Candidatus Saccharimonadia bacterium]|nr:DNA repair protein RecO [Candidatus Saccharimonadia bacterium]